MKPYQYTESGLDTVYLVNGYEFVATPRGTILRIQNIDNLHMAIGEAIVRSSGPLCGKEIRFLRVELGMSQLTLGQMLGVKDQTVARWEKGEVDIPKSSDALLRALYAECASGKRPKMAELLNEIADNEDKRSDRIHLTVTRGKWAA